MITTLLLDALYWIVWVVLTPIRALPMATLPQGLTDALGTIGGYIHGLDVVLPVVTIFAVLSLILVIEGFMFTWKGINWLLRRIPGQS